MNPIAILRTIAGILTVIAVVSLWWYWDDLVSAKRQLGVAQDANKSMVVDKAETKAKDEKIDRTLVNRQKRQEQLDARVGGIEDAIRNLENQQPVVKSWGDVVVPDDLVIVRNLQKPRAGGDSGQAGMHATSKPDGAGQTH